MENAAAKVIEDCDIVEEVVQVDNKYEQATKQDILHTSDTVDGATTNLQNKESINNEVSPFSCCFPKKEDASIDMETANQDKMRDKSSKNCATEIRLFLDSPVYCIFIIVVTFAVFIILLVELFIDAELIDDGENETVMRQMHPNDDSASVSVALHWFSFALLTVFFIEMITRIAIWRFTILKDFISVFDAIVIFLAFFTNLCVTLIVGVESPIDGISLIIILRLVRIDTLIKVKVEMVKKKKEFELEKVHESLYTANCKISTLGRQVKEKDYEIRQLQAYLSGGPTSGDPHMLEVMKSNKAEELKGAAMDPDLQRAIVLSQQAFYEESAGGVDNKAFMHSGGQSRVDINDELKVLVHQRPERHNSEESDVDSGTKMMSYMHDYFSKPLQELASSELSVANESPGARRKNKNKTPIFNANSNNNFANNLDDHQLTLKMLKQDDVTIEPISICIDPTILQDTKDLDSLSEDQKSATIRDMYEMQSESTGNFPLSGSRSVISSPGDVGSLQDDISDTSPSQRKVLNFKKIKNGGSSISSESGYLSEDIIQGKKKLANNFTENDVL